MSTDFKKGDTVRVHEKTFGDGFAYRGRIGEIVSRVERVCYDHHKGSFGDVCTVRFGPGDQIELDTDELDPADAVSALAEVGRFLPTEEDIGRGVVYTPSHGDGKHEDGVITGMNERFVFVRYQDQHPGANGKATSYKDLRWLSTS